MICPGCKKNLSLALSICPSCGTMVGDSVREELASKIVPIPKNESLKNLSKASSQSDKSKSDKPNQDELDKAMNNSKKEQPKIEIQASARRSKTSEVRTKSTDPTLVEFQTKTQAVPEWKLHLQNAVRKRLDHSKITSQSQDKATLQVSEGLEKTKSSEKKNDILERALRRIEKSRSNFCHISEIDNVTPNNNKPKPENKPIKKPEIKTFPIKDNHEGTQKFDTTKLPPLSEVLTKPFEQQEIHAKAVDCVEDSIKAESEYSEEILEDLAPISHRLGAGLFDLVFGTLISLALILPFAVFSKTSFLMETIFAFLTVIAIVMFVYLTTSIAFFGKTIGMRIFSLEIVDVEENEYPTLHQAAINTVVYLLSLLTFGLGFLPALFNQERRAMHDLVAGTIVVKQLHQS